MNNENKYFIKFLILVGILIVFLMKNRFIIFAVIMMIII